MSDTCPKCGAARVDSGNSFCRWECGSMTFHAAGREMPPEYDFDETKDCLRRQLARASVYVTACEGINPEAVPEMLKALQDIAEHTNPEPDTENYRGDDREGCLDLVFAGATDTIAKASPPVALVDEE